jgi:hypothetical protein
MSNMSNADLISNAVSKWIKLYTLTLGLEAISIDRSSEIGLDAPLRFVDSISTRGLVCSMFGSHCLIRGISEGSIFYAGFLAGRISQSTSF